MLTSATTTADLVEFYNLNVPAAQRVDSFADRATAEIACNIIFDRLDAEAAAAAAVAAAAKAARIARKPANLQKFAKYNFQAV